MARSSRSPLTQPARSLCPSITAGTPLSVPPIAPGVLQPTWSRRIASQANHVRVVTVLSVFWRILVFIGGITFVVAGLDILTTSGCESIDFGGSRRSATYSCVPEGAGDMSPGLAGVAMLALGAAMLALALWPWLQRLGAGSGVDGATQASGESSKQPGGKARTVPKPTARIGSKASSWYISQIPESASPTEKIVRLAELRDDRRISESDFTQAKQRIIGPTMVKPAPLTPSTASPRGKTGSGGSAPTTQTQSSSAPQSTPTAPSGAVGSESIATELRRLKELRDEGLLTEEEYELKRRLLAERL